MVYQYVKEPKFFCTSCARSANHQSKLCKPAALPAGTVSKDAGKQKPDVSVSQFKPMKASAIKKIKKAQKRYKKAVKKLKKIEKKQKKLLKRARKVDAAMKGFEIKSQLCSEYSHINRFH
ncbi:hypothetical protein [Vibrio aerogenes]|nr:hypothetical protein [Vibrio aerogenes]